MAYTFYTLTTEYPFSKIGISITRLGSLALLAAVQKWDDANGLGPQSKASYLSWLKMKVAHNTGPRRTRAEACCSWIHGVTSFLIDRVLWFFINADERSVAVCCAQVHRCHYKRVFGTTKLGSRYLLRYLSVELCV